MTEWHDYLNRACQVQALGANQKRYVERVFCKKTRRQKVDKRFVRWHGECKQ